jgi:hypothetical protein
VAVRRPRAEDEKVQDRKLRKGPDEPEDEEEAPRRRGPKASSGKALASLILGLLSFCLNLPASAAAVVLGVMSLADIRRSQGQLAGKGMAIAGIAAGVLGLIVNSLVIGLVLYGLGKARASIEESLGGAATTIEQTNNMRRISLGMLNYADAHGGRLLEDAAIRSPDGKRLLSWRVALLPFVEEDQLYRQFKLDEPWDSPHNKALLSQMPEVYAHPKDPGSALQGLTYYRIFVGPGTPFAPRKPSRFPTSFPDGTSNTIMFVDAAQAVPWTKPDELVMDDGPLLPRLGKRYQNKYPLALWDGSIRWVDGAKLTEQNLRFLITPNGGEIVNIGP